MASSSSASRLASVRPGCWATSTAATGRAGSRHWHGPCGPGLADGGRKAPPRTCGPGSASAPRPCRRRATRAACASRPGRGSRTARRQRPRARDRRGGRFIATLPARTGAAKENPRREDKRAGGTKSGDGADRGRPALVAWFTYARRTLRRYWPPRCRLGTRRRRAAAERHRERLPIGCRRTGNVPAAGRRAVWSPIVAVAPSKPVAVGSGQWVDATPMSRWSRMPGGKFCRSASPTMPKRPRLRCRSGSR